MLNVRFEKMDQAVLKAGLDAAVARWPGSKLVEYAVAESLIIPETSSGYSPNNIQTPLKCPEVNSKTKIPWHALFSFVMKILHSMGTLLWYIMKNIISIEVTFFFFLALAFLIYVSNLYLINICI